MQIHATASFVLYFMGLSLNWGCVKSLRKIHTSTENIHLVIFVSLPSTSLPYIGNRTDTLPPPSGLSGGSCSENSLSWRLASCKCMCLCCTFPLITAGREALLWDTALRESLKTWYYIQGWCLTVCVIQGVVCPMHVLIGSHWVITSPFGYASKTIT